MIWFKWYMIAFLYVPIVIYIIAILEVISITIYVRNNYVIVKKRKINLYQRFIANFNLFMICLIPLFNILWLYYIIANGKNMIVDKWLSSGKIVEKEYVTF